MRNKRKYFGTDGIRGKANSNKMNASLALNIGMATAEYFTRGNHKHFVLIGIDTRLSNYTIEPSLTAGFLSMGMLLSTIMIFFGVIIYIKKNV